jgi:hypothetical protein
MEQEKQIESTRRLTMTYEVSYNFPIGSKNVVRRNVTASTEEEALRVAGVNNPTLKARISPDEINKAHVEALKENEQRNRKRAANGGLRVPVFLAQAIEGDDVISAFVAYLQRSKYRLYLSCKPELVGRGEDEYLVWTGGESLPENAVRTYEDAYGREWFLTFDYSADIQYPVSVIERGTGGGQGTPAILHKNGRCELCYWQVIEQLVRAGLRA